MYTLYKCAATNVCVDKVYMYAHVYTYMHAYTHTYISTHIQIHACIHTRVWTHAGLPNGVYTDKHRQTNRKLFRSAQAIQACLVWSELYVVGRVYL